MKLFISYAHKDATELAKRLAEDLRAAGYEVWIDLVGLSAGKSWAEGIEAAIQACDATVALLSHASYVSEICRAEQTLSIDLKKPVYPVLVQVDAPRPLTLYIRQYLDFSKTAQYGDRLEALKEALTKPPTATAEFRVTPTPRTVINTAPQLPPNFVPRPDMLEKLRNAILSDAADRQIALMAVSGMGGIGKSVLAAALSRDPVVQAAFPDGIVWLSIGREPKSLVEQIKLIGTTLQDLGGDYSSEEAAVARLRAMLPEKAALIVLDDVWDVKHVEPYRLDAPRCRTLITTRSASIGDSVGATPVSLDVMSEDEARNLLKEWSGSDPLPPEADEVAKECGNLPLALAMTGAMIRNGTSWSNALKKLQNAKLDRISEKLPGYDHPDLLRALQVSVDDLDNVRGLGDLKARYFDLTIFREEAAVPQTTLAKYWSPLGLNEDDIEDVVNALANRSLIRIQKVDRGEATDNERTSENRGSQKLITLHDLQLDYIRASVSDAKPLHHRLLKGYTPAGQAWHSAADGYLFPNLVYHLQGAGQESELPTLFANDNWMIGRFNHDGYTYTGFIEDLMTAWDVAEALARTQLAPEQEPMALADCIRYALIRTSINSLASNFVPELVVRAVETGSWTTERALGVAVNITDLEQRTMLYTLLLKCAPFHSEDRARVERWSLEAALAIRDKERRAETLSALAEQLTSGLKAIALAEGLKAVLAIEIEWVRARSLSALAGQLSGDLLTEALKAALAIRDDGWRSGVLRALAGQLSGVLLVEGMKAALATGDERARAMALSVLADQLNGEEKAVALVEALKAALAIPDERYRAETLSVLADQLNGEEKAVALVEALKAALSIRKEGGRATALRVLARQLSGDLLTEAIKAALAMEGKWSRAIGLSALAGQLSGEARATALAEGMKAALAIEDGEARAEALSALAGQLSGRAKAAALEQGMKAALKIRDERSRAEALSALAGQLSGDLLREALKAALAILKNGRHANTLSVLIGQMSGDLLREALEAALAIPDERYRAEALSALAGQLSGEAKATALAEGMKAALAVEDERMRGYALSALAEQLSGDLLAKAMKAALAMENNWSRAIVLSALAGQLSGEAKATALAEGMKAALAVEEAGSRTKALSALAGRLSGKAKSTALAEGMKAALAVRYEESQVEALSALAGQLSGDLLAKAIKTALAFRDERSRAEALSALAGQLSGKAKTAVLAQGMKAALSIEHEGQRAMALSALAGQLSGDLLAEAMRAALSIQDEESHAIVLRALAGQLSGDLLAEGMKAALAIRDEWNRAGTLARMASQLDSTGQEQIYLHTAQLQDLSARLYVYLHLVGLIDDARLLPLVRVDMLQLLRLHQSQTRDELLSLLRDKGLFAPPIVSVPLIERIVDDVIDVCRNWRWQ